MCSKYQFIMFTMYISMIIFTSCSYIYEQNCGFGFDTVGIRIGKLVYKIKQVLREEHGSETSRPYETEQPTERPTDRRSHREVSLQISISSYFTFITLL